VDLFTCNIFSRTFPDFVKFKDLSRIWKMNLLFSRFTGLVGTMFNKTPILEGTEE